MRVFRVNIIHNLNENAVEFLFARFCCCFLIVLSEVRTRYSTAVVPSE